MKTFAFVFAFACLSHSSFCQEKTNSEDTATFRCFLPMETQAEFPGGFDSLKNFLKKNLKYPKQKDVEGKVFVKFYIDVDGSLSDFQILKGLCKECDENTLDALKKMPKWIPRKGNGKAVKSYFVLPIAYSLSQ